ncbi:MAG: hypothetical protein MUO21_06510, partial [Nitrososphaeraceae archaeon]|nr:hypothetical protein [Nitrososphaeraceae archaeon]
MKIQKVFTKDTQDPYQGLSFEKRVSEIKTSAGKSIFKQENVIVPSTWSKGATDILSQKYFRRSGVPLKSGEKGGENDARQVFHRLAHTWSEWGHKYGYFNSEVD